MKKQLKGKLHQRMLLPLCVASLPLVVSAAEPVPAPEANPLSVRAARPPEDKEQLERRLASVATLLEKSSAARQIESSGNVEAQVMRTKARELFRRYPKPAYMTEIESWRELPDGRIEFTMRRLPTAD